MLYSYRVFQKEFYNGIPNVTIVNINIREEYKRRNYIKKRKHKKGK
jgi:hypothetical protein